VERTRDWRCQTSLAQGNKESQSSNEERQDAQTLRESQQYVYSLYLRAARVAYKPVCLVTGEMRLQPNVGSDRSWVYKVAADVAEGAPTSETLAIRFANSEREYPALRSMTFYPTYLSCG
jgi:hypothetical protein